MYLRIIDNDIIFPYDFRMLQRDFPNTSFPTRMTDDLYEQYGVYRVQPTPKPIIDWDKNLVMEVETINNKWVQTWNIVDISEWEREERISQQWDNVRELRNTLLNQSDWTQLEDVMIENKMEWRVYRESLRNITEQSDNPFDIVWPTKPQ
jgi:hypothetical protein